MTTLNARTESLPDGEDMRLRCAAHDEHLTRHPEQARRAEVWADANLDELAGR